MPKHREPTTFWDDFKRFFFRGLAVLLPSVLTIWIIVQLFLFVDAQVAQPINRGIRAAILVIIPELPERFRPELLNVSVTDAEILDQDPEADTPVKQAAVRARLLADKRAERLRAFWEDYPPLQLLGLLVAILLFYFAGLLLQGFIGRAIYTRVERFLAKIPVFKQVYPHVKQLVDLLLGERKAMAFRKVVLVEYPRKGIYTVAFVTSSGMKIMADSAGEEVLSIFVPSTPTPFTGFTITVPKSQTIDLPISVDEAIRFVLTGGVLIPDKQSSPIPHTLPIQDSDQDPHTPPPPPTPPTQHPPSQPQDTEHAADSDDEQRPPTQP